MLKKKLVLTCLLLCIAINAGAVNYYVSPSGDDAHDGLTPATAWKSIDNGDRSATNILIPADTVNILPGRYSITNSVTLQSSGSAGLPIVYRGVGKGKVIVDLSNADKAGFAITGSYLVVDRVDITNSRNDGILLNGHFTTVSRCFIHEVDKIGIHLGGTNNLIVKNIIYASGGDGIKNEDSGSLNLIYNNTINATKDHGIELKGSVTTDRIFNNIVTQNKNRGITGPVQSICGFNNVWGNPGGDYVGVVDSAGGISVFPKFVDTTAGRFDLKAGAGEIDAGLDLGFDFNGSAPEIGAKEKYNTYYISPTGNDSASGKTPGNAWRTIQFADSLLFPGDTVHVGAGIYGDSVIVTDAGIADDDRVVYHGATDSVTLDASGSARGVSIAGDFVSWNGISVTNAGETNLYVTGLGVTVSWSRLTAAGSYGLYSTQPVDLSKNVFASNGHTGAYEVASGGAAVYNNTFYDNLYFGFKTDGGLVDITNDIFQSHDSAAVHAGLLNTVTYSMFFANAETATGGALLGLSCTLKNPQFLDPAGGNFFLAQGSLAIDAGTNVGLPYSGSAPDMGAYESGVLATLAIVPDTDTLFADSTYQFSVIALDTAGLPANPGSLLWSHTFSSGSISSSGLFTPDHIGTGRVIVKSNIASIRDTSILMTVVAGSLSGLTISPVRDTVSADSTVVFTAVGSDSKGNLVTDVGTLNWSVLNGIGTIDSVGLFMPSHAGKGFIRVFSDLGPTSISDTIMVIPGALAYLKVSPPVNTMVEDSSYQYAAVGYDSDSNLVKSLTDSVAWSTTDPGGSISAAGLYHAGLNPSPPLFYVKGVYGPMSDSGVVAIISSNTLHHIRIETESGAPVNDSTLSADNDTTTLFCRSYDSGNNLLGDVSVSWRIESTDSIGTLSDSSGVSTELRLRRPGTGRVIASYSASLTDTTGVLACQAGLPARVVVSPQPDTVSADTTVQFTVDEYDADSNLAVVGVIGSWSVIGGIGSIDSVGLFTPSLAGDGKVAFTGSSLADTTNLFTVIPGVLQQIAVLPDTTIVSADSVRQFTVEGFDGKGNSQDPGVISWSLTTALGSIDSTGLFDAVTAGLTRVIAQSSLGPEDSSAVLEVVAGRPVSMIVSPDTATVDADNYLDFTVSGIDADGNNAALGTIIWSVLGGIGDISSNGRFDPLKVGIGEVAARSELYTLADTTGNIEVTPGRLVRLSVVPDTATAKVGDTIQFSANGYDAGFNLTNMGTLSWETEAGHGTIDTSGLFVATSSGQDHVIASSSIDGVTDTSGAVTIEALSITSIPIGTNYVHPGQSEVEVLTFRITNDFQRDKEVTGISLRSHSRGAGTPAELIAEIDSVYLYVDGNADSTLDPADSLVTSTSFSASPQSLTFAPLTIPAGLGQTFLITLTVASSARDRDSLDIIVQPSTDITTLDGTTIDGSDTVNSLGWTIIDGMVASQIMLHGTGSSQVSPADSTYLFMSVDLPRNGYAVDTLQMFSIANQGTAGSNDFDSLMLYRDNGNNSWDGAGTETRIGRLAFTGDRWVISGLHSPLTSVVNRYYVAGRVASYPANEATVSFGIPLNGVSVVSSNDGPIDEAVASVDTISILTFESVAVSQINVPGGTIIPGDRTLPLLVYSLVNNYSNAVGLDSLTVGVIGLDSHGATQAQIDSQIDSLALYVDKDNNSQTVGAGDSLIATATVTNGRATFLTGGFSCPANGGTRINSIVAYMSLAKSRNGNLISLRLTDTTAFGFSLPVKIDGPFPVSSSTPSVVNAFPASAIVVNPTESSPLFGGQSRKLVLDFSLPSDGYAAAVLNQLTITNAGTLDEADALASMALYADKTGNGFTVDDTVLGAFAQAGANWSLGKLTSTVPVPSRRYFVVVSVLDKQFNVGTLQLQIVTDGVKYASGTTGPDDGPAGSLTERFVFPSDRVTAFPISQNFGTITPGSTQNVLLTFALYNGFVNQAQNLGAVRLTNNSRSASGRAYADHELGSVSLYMDSDNDRLFSNDSLLAVGHFAGGQLYFSGLNQALAPESLAYFFVVSDVPYDLIDSDSLNVQVTFPSDIIFSPSVAVNGDFPVGGGGYAVVDGSVSGQYGDIEQKARSVSPGDTAITFGSFIPAVNGNIADALSSLTVVNARDADASDISRMRLWLDRNGDQTWQETDSLVAALAYASGQWVASGMNLSVTYPAPALMILGDISAVAASGHQIQLRIPINGCEYASNNDGPRDKAFDIGGQLTISNSSLRVAYSLGSATYSVGQQIQLHLLVTNLLDSAIAAVDGLVVGISDSGLVTFDSGQAGPISLTPGETGDFVFYYTANNVGTLFWQLRASAPTLGEYSTILQTDEITIQSAPSQINAQLTNSIPPSVTRGQTNVFPLNIRLLQPDSSGNTALVRIDSVTLNIESSAGVPCPASGVFSRMVILSGYQTLAVIDSVPSQARIDYAFTEPIYLQPGMPRSLSLLVDIDSTASVGSFDIVLTNSSGLVCVDDNTEQQVPYGAGTTFPIRTASCRVDDPSQEMMVSWTSLLSPSVNIGQRGVAVEQLNLRHPGVSGSSQIQLTGLTLSFRDGTGTTISPADLFDAVRLKRQQSVIAEETVFDPDSSHLHMNLSSPVTLSPGYEDSVYICVDIRNTTSISEFQLEIEDSTAFVVRDLSSGSLIEMVSDTAALASGQLFPITSSVAGMQRPAESPTFCVSSLLPNSIVAGVDSLGLMRLNLSYPVDNSYSSVRFKRIIVDCLDSIGKPLYPNDLFDRTGYRLNGGSVTYHSFVKVIGGAAEFDFSDTGIVVTPGASITLDLIADVEALAPFDNFMLVIESVDEIVAGDVTDTTRSLNPEFATSCVSEYPLSTGITEIYQPAGRPSIATSDLPVQIVSQGQQNVTVFESSLSYTSSTPQGDVALNRLTARLMRHTSSLYSAAKVSDVFSSVSLLIDGQELAADSLLEGDSVVLSLPVSEIIERGMTEAVSVIGNIRADAPEGNYRLVIADSTCISMHDLYLLTSIYPSLVDASYPLQGIELSVASGGLEQSFVNYPNPFNPARDEQTTISFVLPEDAYVDIELFSITGDFVKTIADHDFRTAGAHQSDSWSGVNDAGSNVQPGTYYCRITAHYSSGKSESYRRKVAVVR